MISSSFTGTVFKQSKEQRCGIVLHQEFPEDSITINKIRGFDDGGLFGNTDLKVGMELVSVNGVTFNTLDEAISALKQAEGELVVVAKAVPGGGVAVVVKESKDQKCGIAFRQENPNAPVTISFIRGEEEGGDQEALHEEGMEAVWAVEPEKGQGTGQEGDGAA